MKNFETRMYQVSLRKNYLDNCLFSNLTEAMDFIIKSGNPQNYILATQDYTRIFDDSGVFYSDKTYTQRVVFTVYEVWKSDEQGHDYKVKSFHNRQAAENYMTERERHEPGWHFRLISTSY